MKVPALLKNCAVPASYAKATVLKNRTQNLSGKQLAQQQALLLQTLKYRTQTAKPVQIMPELIFWGLWA